LTAESRRKTEQADPHTKEIDGGCPEGRVRFAGGFAEEKNGRFGPKGFIIRLRTLRGDRVGLAFQMGAWLVDPSLNTVSHDGKTTHLEPKVMEVLICLARHPGETLPKDKLLQTVWPDTFVTEDVLTRSISELRRVFEDDAKEPRVIQTIPKRGYRLLAPVHAANGSPHKESSTVAVDAPTQKEPKPVRRYRQASAAAALILVAAAGGFALDLGGVRSHFLVKASAPAIHSLAVLPLANLSNDPSQDYFADGVTDALITDLAQISSLRVISRTSIMHYKNTQKTLPEIARELNVDEIVEGTVQRSGDRVRITAQLIQGPTDTHIWAKSYERDLSDVLTLEGEAAKSVADEIQARLTPRERSRLSQDRPVNLQALEAFLQGEHHYSNYGNGYNASELKKAADYFQQSIDDDPSFAPAYIKLAEAYSRQGETSRSSEVYPREKAVAERALALDPNLSDAHLALADVAFSYEWDWSTAERELRKALELNPSNANAHESLGDYFEAMGRISEGLEEQQRAEELDPQADPDHISNGLYRSRQYDRGIEWLRKQIDINPGEGVHYIQLVDFYGLKGMRKEYVENLERVLVLYGFPQIAESMSREYAAHGYVKSVQEVSAEFESLQASGTFYLAGYLADLYTTIGEKEKALDWLEYALQQRDSGMPYLNCDPGWDPLRSDPRFQDIVRRVGLPSR
jgi:TolB-like protein/DNA-binding winged helix-turn-helix (wHTH) protein/Tfp pilus assembly protein PilF